MKDDEFAHLLAAEDKSDACSNFTSFEDFHDDVTAHLIDRYCASPKTIRQRMVRISDYSID
jgi:hypothetical protein